MKQNLIKKLNYRVNKYKRIIIKSRTKNNLFSYYNTKILGGDYFYGL